MSLAEVGVSHSRTTLTYLPPYLPWRTFLWANALGADSKADKLQFGSKELTLRRLRIEAFSSHNGKDLAQMKQMLLRSFGMNNQVIQVNGDERATAVKNYVHSSLERCRCIAQAKRHNLELIGSKFRLKCCANHMVGKNPNLKKTLLKVHFTKDLGALDAIK